jgi:hypothetical protein
MFPGSPARLRPAVPLHELIRLARPAAVLGVWLRTCVRPAAIRCRGPGGPRHLLAAEDLGYLLRRCREVAVRDGDRVARVPSGVLLGWRVLEIVLATPYLPSAEQLRAMFPACRLREGVIALPIGLGSAEEALAACATARLPVAATRIVYLEGER